MAMQHLNSLGRLMTKLSVSISLLLLFSHVVMANEMKVFLNKQHANQIMGINEAKAFGYKINFIYLDRIDEIQDQVSQRVTDQYQPAIDAVIAEIGLEKLMARKSV
jgi:hypothetical protein